MKNIYLKKLLILHYKTIYSNDLYHFICADDFRIFCGDLGNDVTDEMLVRVFGKYPSFQKAKVVRDKRTNKTKGFGFVSFKDPQDFIKAMKEMNGKIKCSVFITTDLILWMWDTKLYLLITRILSITFECRRLLSAETSVVLK